MKQKWLLIGDLRKTSGLMKFSMKHFFSKCDQIRSKLRIWSHLPKKCLMENFIFYAVFATTMSMRFFVFMGRHLYKLYIFRGCSNLLHTMICFYFAVVIAWCRVQYWKRVSHILQLISRALGEWNNSKIWETRKIFTNIAQGNVR